MASQAQAALQQARDIKQLASGASLPSAAGMIKNIV